MNPGKLVVIFQRWEDHVSLEPHLEYSLHLTEEDRVKFVRSVQRKKGTNLAPTEAYPCEVGAKTFEKVRQFGVYFQSELPELALSPRN